MIDRKYRTTPPKYYRGDRIEFRDRRGEISTGKIEQVTTKFLRSNKGYHVYLVRLTDSRSIQLISEDRIIRIIKK